MKWRRTMSNQERPGSGQSGNPQKTSQPGKKAGKQSEHQQNPGQHQQGQKPGGNPQQGGYSQDRQNPGSHNPGKS
jgi:hypothetical protein